jgi:hypothetical protein
MSRLTTSNGHDYSFAFERQSDASIRPYITSQPDYGSQSTIASDTHRAQDEQGRYYVEWDEPIYTVAEAKEVAGEWAKRTDVYIDTGDWVPYKKVAQSAIAEDDIPEGTFF